MFLKKRNICLIAGCLIQMLVGANQAWSFLALQYVALKPEWTAAQLSLTYSINMVFQATGCLTSSLLLKRFNNQTVSVFFSALAAAGWLLASLTDSSAAMYLVYVGYGVLYGLSCGALYTTVADMVEKSFADKPGTANGLLNISSNCCGYVVSLIIALGIRARGLRISMRVFACIMLVVYGICSMFIKGAETATSVSKTRYVGQDVLPRYAVKSKAFIVYFFWGLLVVAIGLISVNMASGVFASCNAPAELGMLIMITCGIGSFVAGIAADKLGLYKALMMTDIIALVCAACLIGGWFLHFQIAVMAGILLGGCVFGFVISLRMSGVTYFFGLEYAAMNYSLINLAVIPAAFLGPYISGRLQDCCGGYEYSYCLIGMLAIAGLIILLFFKQVFKKE